MTWYSDSGQIYNGSSSLNWFHSVFTLCSWVMWKSYLRRYLCYWIYMYVSKCLTCACTLYQPQHRLDICNTIHTYYRLVLYWYGIMYWLIYVCIHKCKYWIALILIYITWLILYCWHYGYIYITHLLKITREVTCKSPVESAHSYVPVNTPVL